MVSTFSYEASITLEGIHCSMPHEEEKRMSLAILARGGAKAPWSFIQPQELSAYAFSCSEVKFNRPVIVLRHQDNDRHSSLCTESRRLLLLPVCPPFHGCAHGVEVGLYFPTPNLPAHLCLSDMRARGQQGQPGRTSTRYSNNGRAD